ncbi:MAG: hypothetical protein MAG795_00132 [Candidatus Woesearchaeota archaeon]|nr:hypothetical protein [Candidatus Woesearchaeota archaeon]
MNKKGLKLVLMTAIISGVSIFLNKFGVQGVNPYVFTFLKNTTVATLLLSLILLLKDKTIFSLSKKQYFKLSAIGLFGGSIPFLLFFKGLQLTSSASAGFIHKTMFIWVFILAVLFLRENINKKILVPALLIILGNFLLLKINSFSWGFGESLILGATLFWSIENIISKNALNELDAKTVVFGRMFFGSLFILMFLVASGNIKEVVSLSLSQILWTGFTSVLLMGYVFTYYNGLKFVSPTIATSILLLASPITTVLNFVFLDKMISVPQVIGIILLFSGVVGVLSLSENIQITWTANPR